MGIESNLKAKFLTTLTKDPEWNDFLNSLFSEIDFFNIFKVLVNQGVPIYFSFDDDAGERGYLEPISQDSDSYTINLDFTNVLLSVNSPFTLEFNGFTGSTVRYSNKDEGALILHTPAGDYTSAIFIIESAPTSIEFDVNYLLLILGGNYLRMFLPLLYTGVTSLYSKYKILHAYRTTFEQIQLFIDGTQGQNRRELTDFIDITQVSGSTIIKNETLVLQKDDIVLSEEIGGTPESYILEFGSVPQSPGNMILVLNDVAFNIYVSTVSTIQELIDLVLAMIFPNWILTQDDTNQILIQSVFNENLTGAYSISEILETRELVVLTIGQTASFGGTLHIGLNGVDFPITVLTGQTPTVLAGFIAGLSFPGWEVSSESGTVFFLREVSGTQIPPYVIDYGSNAMVVFQLNTVLITATHAAIVLDGTTYYIPMEVSDPSTIGNDVINFVNNFNEFNLTTNTGWVASVVEGNITLIRTPTGPTPIPELYDAGNHEVVTIEFGSITLQPSYFIIGLDGVDYDYYIGATETLEELANRMLTDIRILVDWEIEILGTPGPAWDSFQIQYTNRAIKTCIAPTIPDTSSNSFYPVLWTTRHVIASSTFWTTTFNLLNNDEYIFTIQASAVVGSETEPGKIINTDYGESSPEDVILEYRVIEVLCLIMNGEAIPEGWSGESDNETFVDNWEALINEARYDPITKEVINFSEPSLLIQRREAGIGWITNPDMNFGNVDYSTGTQGPEPDPEFAVTISPLNIGNLEAFEFINLDRYIGGIGIEDWATLIFMSDGINGVVPSIVRQVEGVQGANPTIELEDEGSSGEYFEFPVLAHDKSILVLGIPDPPTIEINEEVYSYEDFKPEEGRFSVIKLNYQTTINKDSVLDSKVIVNLTPNEISELDNVKELVKSLYPARVSVAFGD